MFGFRGADALRRVPLTDSVVPLTDFAVHMAATHVRTTRSHVYMTTAQRAQDRFHRVYEVKTRATE